MKATGMIRRVDGMGRMVIPMELRRTLDLPVGVPMEIFVDRGQIILRKYEPGCVFCNNLSGVVRFKDKYVCDDCRKLLRGMGNGDEA